MKKKRTCWKKTKKKILRKIIIKIKKTEITI